MLPFAEAAPDATTLGTVVLALVTVANLLLHCKQLFGWGRNAGDAATRSELARVEAQLAARIEKLAAYGHKQAHEVRDQLNAMHLGTLARVEEVARRMERLAARLGD